MAKQLYHLPNIRGLLLNGFTDLDLRRLCYDVPDFRPVYDELAQGTGKAEIVDKLIEYADKTLQIDTLLALAKERSPARYEKHGPYYADDPTAALQKQVSDLAQRLSAITSATSLTREQQYQVAVHWAELGRKDSLRGFDLSGTDLRGVDLAGANLCLADLHDAQLRLADLAKADLRFGNLHGTDLGRADLREADLNSADLTRSDLTKVNLIKTNLTDADLSGANLSGADLYEVKLGGANLSAANLHGTNLHEANLSGANLSGADLREAKLYRANLSGANLSNANLRQAVVEDWRVSMAMSLKGATMPDGTRHG